MSAQRTIAEETSFTGIGLHSGESTTVTVKPAPMDTGFQFVRVDLPEKPALTAHPDLLVSASVARPWPWVTRKFIRQNIS